ncbi:MAG: Serine/threonine-protein kinase PK-1 [Candidatus Hydrogenedentes bacterium ADurb.Bin101]|nr:MAG: Serine/threonine-protein kinase PK-1 [Candidatus Hydrogenedentes bacterium ADurb.Bin101]
MPAEGEGEVPAEGEGEVPAEGEGEVPAEGEGEVPAEGEGEVPAEGEGEVPAEGEGEVPAEGEGEKPGVIDAVDDNFTGASGNANVGNVLSNDTLDGAAANVNTVTISVVASKAAGIALDSNTGIVRVNPGTAAGDYEMMYRICEKSVPENCDTATVKVTVAAEPILVAAPNVAGMPLADVIRLLSTLGLRLGTVDRECNDDVPENGVISQSPAAGTQVAPGTAVNLVVSTGNCPCCQGVSPIDPTNIFLGALAVLALLIASLFLAGGGEAVPPIKL